MTTGTTAQGQSVKERGRIPKGKKREPVFYEIDCPDVDPDVLKEQAAQYLADSFSLI